MVIIMNSISKKILDLALIALGTAIVVVLTFVSIPMPSGVPITLQTFGIALVGFILGKKNATIALIIYLLLGAIGIPVFSGFNSGLGAILGFTGGFIWGFIILAFFCGFGGEKENYFFKASFSLIGLAVCHVLGTIQYSIVSTNALLPSFLLVSAPYLIKDVVSLILAFFVAKAVNLALEKSGVKKMA